MKIRLFNLNSFYKYKSEIDKKNVGGLWWNATVFEALLFLDLLMKVVLAPEEIQYIYAVYAVFCALAVLTWYKIRGLSSKIQDVYIILEYVFGFTFVCHCQLIYGNHVMFPLFLLTAIDLACVLLMNPFFIILGQVMGCGAFFICYYISNDKVVTPFGVLFIIATLMVSLLLGFLVWYVRTQNIIFNNELLYITTGSDDRFAGESAKAFWEGKSKYGIANGSDDGKRKTFTIVFNLTRNRLESVRENNIFELKPVMDWEEMTKRIMRYAGDPKTYRNMEHFFDSSKFSSSFKNGDVKKSVIGSFNLRGGDRMWLDFEMSLRPHPISGELMNTLIIEDVTDDRILMGILNRLISKDYDMVMCLEKGKHNSLIFKVREGDEVKGTAAGDYETEMVTYITEEVADYDRERVLECAHLKNVYEELKTKDSYEFYVDEYHIGDAEIQKKHFSYSYLDPGKRFLVVLKQDITDLVKKNTEAKKKLEVALKEANAANNVKTEFLSRMSHEMRTPMNAIMGLASLIEDEVNNPEALKEYVKKIKGSSDFLLQLINDVLDMSVLEEGRLTIHEEPICYGEIIRDLEIMIGPMSREKNITYICNSEIPEGTVIKTDRMRVTQVLVNLLENAVKYTAPGGRVEFNGYNVGENEGRSFYRFVVKDNGIGMSEEFITRMFEPFTQESENNKQNLNGTGLGLSISKGIVDLLGGTISATSKQNVGTTFVVDLSFETASEMKAPEPLETYSEEDLAGKRILVVEDNEINCDIAVAILERKGVLADTAYNGAEAVERFLNSDEWYYDAVLMDIRMPKMNGLEATRKIRNLNRKDSQVTPIIAMTANAFSDDVSLSAHSGMNAHLSKPINPSLLYETILREIAKAHK